MTKLAMKLKESIEYSHSCWSIRPWSGLSQPKEALISQAIYPPGRCLSASHHANSGDVYRVRAVITITKVTYECVNRWTRMYAGAQTLMNAACRRWKKGKIKRALVYSLHRSSRLRTRASSYLSKTPLFASSHLRSLCFMYRDNTARRFLFD